MIHTSKHGAVSVPAVSMAEYALRHARKLHDKPAIIDGTTGASMTYGDLAGSVRALATGLAARGFAKGDVLAIYCPNTIEYPVILLAVASLGGVVTPVNPMTTARDLGKQLDDAGARFVVTAAGFLDKATEAALGRGVQEIFTVEPSAGVMSLAELSSLSADSPAPAVGRPQDLVALPYSSGTTGLPKGVMLTQRHVVTNLCQWSAMEDTHSYTEDDVVLGVLPFFHIYGMVVVQMACLAGGSTLIVMPRFEPELMLDLIERHKITALPIVPPIAQAIIRNPGLAARDLSSVRLVISGAAPLRTEVQDTLSRTLDCAVIQGYGMTETAGVTHVSPRSAVTTFGTIGPLVPGTEAKIADLTTGAALPVGETGELLIRGPQVMTGYLNQPEMTALAIDAGGWYHTGDIALVDANGDFFIVDRLKELIKYKGYGVAPAELEALLLEHPSVADAAVVPHPDDESGEIPKAFIVRRPGHGVEPGYADDLMAWVAERVAPYKRIRLVEFVDEVPRSPAGKLLRRVLLQRDERVPAPRSLR